MSSQDVLQFLHTELSGRIDSESASELLAKGRLASLLAPRRIKFIQHLDPGVFAAGAFERRSQQFRELRSRGHRPHSLGFSSQLGGLSSQLGGLSSEVLAGGSETVASWQAGVRAIISNWEQALSSLGLGSEVMASWHAGLGEIASSFTTAVTSYGLSSETLASWQAGVGEIFAKWETQLELLRRKQRDAGQLASRSR